MASQGYVQLIEECEEHSSKLTDWECNFIDSLGGYLRYGGFIDNWKAERLEEIWERVTRDEPTWAHK